MAFRTSCCYIYLSETIHDLVEELKVNLFKRSSVLNNHDIMNVHVLLHLSGKEEKTATHINRSMMHLRMAATCMFFEVNILHLSYNRKLCLKNI